MTLIAALATTLLVGAPDHEPTEARRVTLDVGVTLAVPAGFSDDETALAEGGLVLAVSRDDSALLVTVYTGRRAPSHAAALDVHTEELSRRLGEPSEGPQRVRQRFVGRVRGARELAFEHAGTRYAARVVTARHGRRTLVATWTWPDGSDSGDALTRAVESMVAR